jgi:hypothetical protein
MTRSLAIQFSRVSKLAAAICVVAFSQVVLAHETEIKTADPGFRPPSEYAPAFLESLDTATITVYPTIVRRADRTAHSFASQSQIIDLLNSENIVMAVAGRRRIDLGKLKGRSQYDLFLESGQRIAEVQRTHPSGAEYLLVMEFLFPVNNQTIFGIQCYVLNSDGENAFSFLLNSHHQLFVDAKLIADGTSEAARAKLMAKATQAGVTALKQQIEHSQAVEPGLILHESPINDMSSMMTFAESDLGGLYVAEKTMRLMCGCAQLTQEKGYQYFMIEEPHEKSGAEMRFKINFYEEPPPGLPVVDLRQAPDTEAAPGKGVLDARDWAQFCGTTNQAKSQGQQSLH